MSNSRGFTYISISLLAVLLTVALLFLSVPALVVAEAEGEYYLDLSTSVAATAPVLEDEEDSFRYVREGDTFTITYALVRNDGLDVSFWFPEYDASAFLLTSVSVDHHWAVQSEFYYEDETVGLAEHVTRYNAEYLAHEADEASVMTYSRISFEIDSVAFGDYPTSDAFITLTYTARRDILDAADFDFGFDFDLTALGFATTNAAKHALSGTPKALTLRMVVSENSRLEMASEAAATRYTPKVIPTIIASLVPNQTITFHDGVADPSDIRYTLTYPPTPDGGENPYEGEFGGVSEYIFYADDNGAAGEELGGVPTLPGDYFVKAVFANTEHYRGMTTEVVKVTVAKESIAHDFSARITGEEDAHVPDASATIDVAFDYGHTMTVYEGVSAIDIHKYNCTFYALSANEAWEETEQNLFIPERLNAGTYKATIRPLDPARQTFGIEGETYTILIAVARVAITVTANSYEITYGDGLPTFAYSVAGTVAGDNVNAELGAQLTLAAAYATASGAVGEYPITVAGEGTITNYTVTYYAGALTVLAKELVLTVTYEGAYASFSVDGFIYGEEDLPVNYYVAENEENKGDPVGDTVDAVTVYNYVPAAQPTMLFSPKKNRSVYANSPLSVYAEATTNYVATSVVLRRAYKVTYASTAPAAVTSELPETEYLFGGSLVATPSDDPTATKYEFRYWAVGEEKDEYDFEDEVLSDVVIYALFEKMEYDYVFYAAEGEHYGALLPLAWDGAAFAPADEATAITFRKYTAISMRSEVRYFRIAKWVKAVPNGDGYTYTDITEYEPEATSEGDSGIKLIASMAFDVAPGDLNGDRSVNVDDLIRFERYSVLTDYSAITISDVATAWSKVTETNLPDGGYFFTAALDVTRDGHADVLDIVALAEAFVGSYEYVIVEDATTDGAYHAGDSVLARATMPVEVGSVEELMTKADCGATLLFTEDITVPALDYEGPEIVIDLGGHTITLDALTMDVFGRIVFRNGQAVIGTYTLRAVGGIYIEDVTGLPDASGEDEVTNE